MRHGTRGALNWLLLIDAGESIEMPGLAIRMASVSRNQRIGHEAAIQARSPGIQAIVQRVRSETGRVDLPVRSVESQADDGRAHADGRGPHEDRERRAKKPKPLKSNGELQFSSSVT